HHLFHHLRRGILVVALALAGLAALAPAAPAAHAAGPSLYLIGQGGGVYVSGTSFTPGVQVRVEVLNSSMTTAGSVQNLTAQPCSSGGCSAPVLPAGFTGAAWVPAAQTGWPTTWAQTTIYQDPYITAYTEPGPYSSGIVVSGSGYTPGASVKVQVSQLCGVFCWKVLSTQTVTASFATQSDADYGLIYAAGRLSSPAHSGTVYVSASGGGPNQSNVVWLSIP